MPRLHTQAGQARCDEAPGTAYKRDRRSQLLRAKTLNMGHRPTPMQGAANQLQLAVDGTLLWYIIIY